MPSVVVFDLEGDSKLRFANYEDRDEAFRYSQITVACALVLDAKLCVSNSEDAIKAAKAVHFWRDESPLPGQDPFSELLRLFDDATIIVAYNGLDYDFKMLKKHYSKKTDPLLSRYTSHRLKCLDMFSNLKAALGSWPKLDDLLKLNGLETKTASGLEAISMWEDGRRDELLSYCEADVALLAKLSLKDAMLVPKVGRVPAAVYQIQSNLASRAAKTPEGDWELVD